MKVLNENYNIFPIILPLLSVQSFFGDLGLGNAWNIIWLPLVLLAVFVSIMIYTIILMFARGFNIPELERSAKGEMLEAAATAFMAIFLVLLVHGAIGLAATILAMGAGETPEGGYAEEATVTFLCKTPMHLEISKEVGMDQLIDGVRCRIKERAFQIAKTQAAVATGAETWATFNFRNFATSIFGLTIFKGEWIGHINKEVEDARIINNIATVLLISLNAQSYLLSYIKANMIHVFLPVGILLRSFKFTRGVGAFFISLAIGLYFVFPVIFVLLDPGFVGVTVPEPTKQEISQYCYPTMGAATAIYTTMEHSAAATGGSELQLGNLKDSISKTYIALILHPFIAFSLTIIVVRYLMTVLGGEAYMLMRLVTKVI
ncbi:MAG: hypothetical protein QW590_01910 [Candidatus Bilamarchaeaceae archaeon]